MQCLTSNAAQDFSRVHKQGESLTQANTSALLQMLQTTFVRLISKWAVLSTQSKVHDPKPLQTPRLMPVS